LLCVPKEPGRPWDAATGSAQLDAQTVPNFTIRRRQARADVKAEVTRLIHVPVGLLPALARFRPDVIVTGGFSFPSLMALVYAKVFRRPWVLVSEETSHGAAGITGAQRKLRRLLIRNATAFLAYGRAAQRYLVEAGARPEAVQYCAQAVNTSWWSAAVDAARGDAARLRDELGVRGRVALYAGQLVPRKGVSHLLAAWRRLPAEVQQSNTLLIVGDGEEAEGLRRRAGEWRLAGVVFVGLQPPEKLAAYYALADVFVLPTLLDVWGLVVNEAMAAGIPVLVSQFAGCAEELVVEGVTGNTFDPRDETRLSQLIAEWLRLGPRPPVAAVRQRAATLSFESAARGTVAAILGAHARKME
jgi:glycosyltransferase involved in cell wall biosynthesis